MSLNEKLKAIYPQEQFRVSSAAICKLGHTALTLAVGASQKLVDVGWNALGEPGRDDLALNQHIDSLTSVRSRGGVIKGLEDHKNLGIDKVDGYFLDVIGLGDVNNSNTQDVGDKFLKVFAYGLKKYFPEDSVIGRIGGDEFVVFTPSDVISVDALEILLSNRDESNIAEFNLKKHNLNSLDLPSEISDAYQVLIENGIESIACRFNAAKVSLDDSAPNVFIGFLQNHGSKYQRSQA